MKNPVATELDVFLTGLAIVVVLGFMAGHFEFRLNEIEAQQTTCK